MNSSRTFQTRRSFLLKAAGTAGAAAVGPPTLLNALGSAFSKSTSGPPGLAQLIEVDFAQKDPADSSLYGRYLNFCGNTEQFTEQDFHQKWQPNRYHCPNYPQQSNFSHGSS